MRARGVIACVDSDAENIFITLSARQLRPDIAIVARAASEDVGGQAAARGRDARDLAVPVERLGDGAPRAQPAGVGRGRRRARVPDGGDRRSRRAARARRRTIADVRGGAIIVGVRSADGTFQPQPPVETVLQRRRRRDGDGHAAHRGAPRGAVRARADGDARRDARSPTCAPPSRRRPPALANGGVAEVAARRSSAPSRPSTATTRRTPRSCSRRCSRRRRARSPSGWAARCATGLGEALERVEVAGPGLPQPLPRRRLVRRGARLGARGRRRLRRRRRRAARCGSTSSSSRPTRPGR